MGGGWEETEKLDLLGERKKKTAAAFTQTATVLGSRQLGLCAGGVSSRISMASFVQLQSLPSLAQ